MTEVEARALTDDERGVLLAITREASKQGIAAGLDTQVPLTTVVGGLPTLLHLTVALGAPPSRCKNGPLPLVCHVIGEDGQYEGRMLVWIEDGYLSALEFAWVTDEAPEVMPDAGRLAYQ